MNQHEDYNDYTHGGDTSTKITPTTTPLIPPRRRSRGLKLRYLPHIATTSLKIGTPNHTKLRFFDQTQKKNIKRHPKRPLGVVSLGSKPNGYSPGYINIYPAKNQILTLQRDLQLAHAQANMSKRQAPTPQTIIYFYFFGTFPPPK